MWHYTQSYIFSFTQHFSHIQGYEVIQITPALVTLWRGVSYNPFKITELNFLFHCAFVSLARLWGYTNYPCAGCALKAVHHRVLNCYHSLNIYSLETSVHSSCLFESRSHKECSEHSRNYIYNNYYFKFAKKVLDCNLEHYHHQKSNKNSLSLPHLPFLGFGILLLELHTYI